MIIIAIILAVIVLFAFALSAGNEPKNKKSREELVKHFEQQAKREEEEKKKAAEKEAKEHDRVEDQKQPDRYTRFLTFNIAGMNRASERGKELANELAVGDAVVLVPEFYNIYDNNAIAIYIYGTRIGYMPASLAATVAKTIFTGHSANYTVCQVSEIIKDDKYEMPIIQLAVFAKTKTGEDALISDKEPALIYIEPIEGCGVDYIDDILHKGYLMSLHARQMIYSHPEWYEGEDELHKDEDDDFFMRFINKLFFGGIKDKEDYQDFLKDVRRDRVRGDNKILIKRIKHYLKIREIELL